MSLFGRLLAILLPPVALLRDQEGVVDRALAHARREGRPVSRRLFCSAGEIMYQWLDIYLQVQRSGSGGKLPKFRIYMDYDEIFSRIL